MLHRTGITVMIFCFFVPTRNKKSKKQSAKTTVCCVSVSAALDRNATPRKENQDHQLRTNLEKIPCQTNGTMISGMQTSFGRRSPQRSRSLEAAMWFGNRTTTHAETAGKEGLAGKYRYPYCHTQSFKASCTILSILSPYRAPTQFPANLLKM